MAPLLASELAQRGRTGLVFRGSDGLDELTTTGPSQIWVVFQGKVTEFTFDPATIGIPRATVEQLLGGDAVENAAVAKAMFGLNTGFSGDKSAIQDIVALNAAAGITAYELSKLSSIDQFKLEESLAKNYTNAKNAMNDGRVLAKMNQWVQLSQSFGE
jgi:anthranilate phosphoribosyltransferase